MSKTITPSACSETPRQWNSPCPPRSTLTLSQVVVSRSIQVDYSHHRAGRGQSSHLDHLDSLVAGLPIRGPLARRSASQAGSSLPGCAATRGSLGISVGVSAPDRATSAAPLARSAVGAAAESPTGLAPAFPVPAYYSPVSPSRVLHVFPETSVATY